ncbi:MAG: HAMP domain-containing histidine kinase [Acidobacteria bacterium]|nr:HAMP domain-containing histidine kinase [Acidobacteriota bacterium]
MAEGRHHVLFLASVLTLLILGSYWTILFRQNVEEIHQASLEHIRMETQLEALRMQAQDEAMPQAGDDREIVPLSGTPRTGYEVPLGPRWPDLALRPSAELIGQIEQRYRIKLIQVVGEGALLVILILITMLMLYYMFLVEARVRRSMENFLSTVTHELKTPIAGMKALLQTLSTRSIPEEKQAEYLEMGLRESARLQHLVDNVLVANRLDRKRMQVEVQPVELRPLLERVVGSWRRVFPAAGMLRLSCQDSIVVAADPEAVGIVLDNLLDNAFKYSPQPPHITIDVESDEDSVSIAVGDQGIGMDAADMENIFDKFHRATQNGVKTIKGSGLGLYIARNLTRAVGGELTAESDGRGRGSTFRLRLKPWR